MDPLDHDREIQVFERDAELLAVDQLDLLAHLEGQFRAVHHTMRHIEKLRSAKNRVGPELSNGERLTRLTHLHEEIAALHSQIGIGHECCTDMQDILAKMRARLADLR